MEANPGTVEGDELELLTTLVELYEDKNFPIDLPDPVDAVRFRMEQAGLRQQDLVPYIGTRSKVSEVLNRKRPLSLKMIRALHAGLGIPAEVLLRDPGARIPDDAPGIDWNRFPIKEMLDRGWLGDFEGSQSDAKERAEELVRRFLEPIGPTGVQPALARQHVRSGSEMDAYALLAWRARVLILAQQQTVPEYKQGCIRPDFMQGLVNLSYLDEGPKLAQEFLAKNGIHLVVQEHLPRTHLDGAAIVLPGGSPVVALTLRYDRLDNFWFTLCHELAHIALHLAANEHDWFVDDLTKRKGDKLEDEADKFATVALIPPKLWKKASVRNDRSASAVREFADSLRIHPAIVAGRIRKEQNNYRLLGKLVGQGLVRKHFNAA